MHRPWQPAIPQAMQRHGGRPRPQVQASAKPSVTPSRANAQDDERADDKRNDPVEKATAAADAERKD